MSVDAENHVINLTLILKKLRKLEKQEQTKHQIRRNKIMKINTSTIQNINEELLF
jgi:hypothetical protein